MNWDPRFVERSPMLSALAAPAASLSTCAEWPRREVLQALMTAHDVRNARGIQLRIVAPEPKTGLSYEARLYDSGELEVREGEWHDVFNVLAWLSYPRTKAALNERHVAAALAESGAADARRLRGRNRGRVRDALTVLDESGAIVVSTDAQLIEDLRAFRWKRLFWERREDVVASMGAYIFGHGLFEKALNPYVGVTAHALTIVNPANFLSEPIERQIRHVDALAAGYVRAATGLDTPQLLAPLPLLGVPGWWADNEREDFYDNTDYFRPGRQNR